MASNPLEHISVFYLKTRPADDWHNNKKRAGVKEDPPCCEGIGGEQIGTSSAKLAGMRTRTAAKHCSGRAHRPVVANQLVAHRGGAQGAE